MSIGTLRGGLRKERVEVSRRRVVLLEHSAQNTPPHLRQCWRGGDTMSTEQGMIEFDELTCLRSQMEKGLRQRKVSQ